MALPRMAAKSILVHAERLTPSLTNLTLHKLLYFAHGLLAWHDRPLVAPPFQVWKYGPVLESLYDDLKPSGASPVSPNSRFISTWEPLPPDAEEVMQAIESILAQFGDQSAVKLIDVSHDCSGPWSAVYGANTQSIAIDDEQIKNYFRSHLRQ